MRNKAHGQEVYTPAHVTLGYTLHKLYGEVAVRARRANDETRYQEVFHLMTFQLPKQREKYVLWRMWKRSYVLEYGSNGILTTVNDSASTNLIIQYYKAIKIWTVTLFMACECY